MRFVSNNGVFLVSILLIKGARLRYPHTMYRVQVFAFCLERLETTFLSFLLDRSRLMVTAVLAAIHVAQLDAFYYLLGRVEASRFGCLKWPSMERRSRTRGR